MSPRFFIIRIGHHKSGVFFFWRLHTYNLIHNKEQDGAKPSCSLLSVIIFDFSAIFPVNSNFIYTLRFIYKT